MFERVGEVNRELRVGVEERLAESLRHALVRRAVPHCENENPFPHGGIRPAGFLEHEAGRGASLYRNAAGNGGESQQVWVSFPGLISVHNGFYESMMYAEAGLQRRQVVAANFIKGGRIRLGGPDRQAHAPPPALRWRFVPASCRSGAKGPRGYSEKRSAFTFDRTPRSIAVHVRERSWNFSCSELEWA